MRILPDEAARVRLAREAKGWTQERLTLECERLHARARDEYTVVSARTVQRLESTNGGNFRADTVRTVVAAVGLRWDDFGGDRKEPPFALPPDDGQWAELAKVGRIATYYAMVRARDVLRRPYLAGEVQTLPGKIRAPGVAPEADPTAATDGAAAGAYAEVFDRAFGDPSSPLHRGGALWLDEELGCVTRYLRGDAPPRWIILTDPVDDTARAKRFSGGTSLFAVYDRRAGWAVAVVGDLCRMNLYHRVVGFPTVGARLACDDRADRGLIGAPFPFEEPPTWSSFAPRPGARTELRGASVNLYTGKPARVTETAARGRALLDALGGGEVLGEGGSRGPLWVCENLIDAAVECVRGFRPLDMVPGCFLALGGGACVTDLRGAPLSFGPDPDFEEVIDECLQSRVVPAAFERLRRKFIVACTPQLAAAIAACFADG